MKAAEEQTAAVSATTFPMSLDEPSNDEAQETLREGKGAAVDEESQSASSDLHRSVRVPCMLGKKLAIHMCLFQAWCSVQCLGHLRSASDVNVN